MALDVVPMDVILLRTILPFFFSRQKEVLFRASSMVEFLSVWGHLASRTLSFSTRPSGQTPSNLDSSSHTPVSTTCRPFFVVNAFKASDSLVTPHCTALTLERSYSPMRPLTREGVTHLTFSAHPKLLAVS